MTLLFVNLLTQGSLARISKRYERPSSKYFFYYRGPSKNRELSLYDFQVEDNTTKSLINIFEFCCQSGFGDLFERFLKEIGAPKRPVAYFRLQKGLSDSRPDALIDLADYNIHIESKVRAKLDIGQIKRHLEDIGAQDILVVITNDWQNKKQISEIGDRRLRYLDWAEVHKLCLKSVEAIRADRHMVAILHLIEQFIDYMEVNRRFFPLLLLRRYVPHTRGDGPISEEGVGKNIKLDNVVTL